jgi:FkbM family methyltransferase
LTTLARGVLASPARSVVVPTVRYAARRWPGKRLASSSAYYLGAAMSLRRERAVGKLVTGASIALNLEDYAHHHIYFFGTYEEHLTRFFVRTVGPDITFVDVGANAGYFTLLVSDLSRQTARIVSFEPNPAVADLLEESLELNRAYRITLVRAACGRSSATAPLFVNPDPTNSGRTTLLAGVLTDAPSIDVRLLPLDEYCREHDLTPDVIKIDVEGFESEVVRGMQQLLERRVPRHVIMEVRDVPGRVSPTELAGELRRHGYVAHVVTESGSLVPVERLKIAAEETRDLVFSRA